MAGGSLDQVWDLPGVEVPHDLEVVAAPVWAGAGRQRPVALMVTETRMQDSRLLKFILLPAGRTPFAVACCSISAEHTFPLPFPWLPSVRCIVLYCTLLDCNLSERLQAPWCVPDRPVPLAGLHGSDAPGEQQRVEAGSAHHLLCQA